MNLATSKHSYLEYNSIQTFLMKSTDHKINFVMPNSVCIVYLWIMYFKMYFTVEVINEKLGRKVTQQTPNIPTISQLCSGFLPSGKKTCLHLLRKVLLPQALHKLEKASPVPHAGKSIVPLLPCPCSPTPGSCHIAFLMTALRQKPETVRENPSTWRAESISTRFFLMSEFK